MSTHYISKVSLNNEEYNFKDARIRAELPELEEEVDNIIKAKNNILGIQVDYENYIITRLGAAVGLEHGSDFDKFTMYGNRRRCTVDDDGTIIAYYGDQNFVEDGSNGQVMVEQPKFYYKVEYLKLEPQYDENTAPYRKGYYVRKANYLISSIQHEGFKVHPAFINENGEEVDYVYIGAYQASIYDTNNDAYLVHNEQIYRYHDTNHKMSSIAGVRPATGVDPNGQSWANYDIEHSALHRGTGWHAITIRLWSMEQLLALIEFGTFDIISLLGTGLSDIYTQSADIGYFNGSTSDFGNTSGQATSSIDYQGNVDTSKGAVTYRGIENFYGNIKEFIPDIIIREYKLESNADELFICDDFNIVEGTVSSSTANYSNPGFTLCNDSGWVSAFGYYDNDFDWLFYPAEAKGNSINPTGIKYYYTRPSSNRVKAYAKELDNIFNIDHSVYPWNYWEYYGSRLAYWPQNNN